METSPIMNTGVSAVARLYCLTHLRSLFIMRIPPKKKYRQALSQKTAPALCFAPAIRRPRRPAPQAYRSACVAICCPRRHLLPTLPTAPPRAAHAACAAPRREPTASRGCGA
jgi:hypothetical protein